jgi:hypothetical protein
MTADRKSSSKKKTATPGPTPRETVVFLKDLAPRTDVHGGAGKKLFGQADLKKPKQ